MKRHQCSVALLVGALLLGACKGTADPQSTTSSGPPNGSAAVNPAAEGDGEVVEVLAAVDGAEIQQGMLARERAADARVRDYGQSMVTMHGASAAKLTALRQRVGIAPRESDRSRSLGADAAATHQRLSGLQGADFDRAYVESQVAQHARVLDAIDGALLHMARNAELHNALTGDVRPMVMEHLRLARELQGGMAAAPTNGTAAGATPTGAAPAGTGAVAPAPAH